MNASAVCAVLVAVFAAPLQAQGTVHGVVFNDSNGNGVRDRGEGPVPGVVVSDQVDVVSTDRAGGYTLSANEGTIIFVSVPTDWKMVGPSWRVVGGGDSISFALRAERQPRSFRFIHASDTHIDTGNVDRVRHFRAMADSIAPALTLIAGDLIRDAASQQEPRARGFFELFQAELRLRAPFWTVPGNHDHFGIVPSRSHIPATHPLYDRGMYRLYRGPE
ncbi:MAG TPA: metallophosphoesterase, partial [Gemmatimonadales bacterium]|nr:metallophosphoesterase [Gemmatimonadales bacterium]